MTSDLKPLEEEEIFRPAIAIIHGWLALLRDNTGVPGQVLEDQAVFLIREFKKYSRDTQEAYQTGKVDGQKIAKREVVEKVKQALKAKQEMSHSMETNILSGSVRMSVVFEVLNDLLEQI
jgi:hypothetical protein